MLAVVQRIHYLRARANKHRWNEELKLVEYEMQWTARFYMNQATIWDERAANASRDGAGGAVAYAHKKAAMWRDIMKEAERLFVKINTKYVCII